MCSAPKQGQTLPAGVDVEKETVITGRVVDGSGQPVGGDFRFFAAPGSWTVRALSSLGSGDAVVAPHGAGIHEVDVKVA
jgi:hypothetical protein